MLLPQTHNNFKSQKPHFVAVGRLSTKLDAILSRVCTRESPAAFIKLLISLACHVIHGDAGGERVVVKKESTATLMRKQQARQQASLASVYERNLALERAASAVGQENTEQAAVMHQLADEVAALSSIHEPIKGRAGMCTCAITLQNILKLAHRDCTGTMLLAG